MTTTTTQVKRSALLHVMLWIVQALLAAMFLGVGYMKAATPLAELSNTIPLAKDLPVLIRFIGVAEIAAGLGLILPAALRIQPRLTAVAGAGIAVIMLLALIFHMLRGELSAIGTNILLGALALFVAWGRSVRSPIVSRR